MLMITQEYSKSHRICTSPTLSCKACIYELDNGFCGCNRCNSSEIKQQEDKPIVIMMDEAKPVVIKNKRNVKKIKT